MKSLYPENRRWLTHGEVRARWGLTINGPDAEPSQFFEDAEDPDYLWHYGWPTPRAYRVTGGPGGAAVFELKEKMRLERPAASHG